MNSKALPPLSSSPSSLPSPSLRSLVDWKQRSAGDWLFAVNDKGQLAAVSRANGKIKWINQLPHYEKEKSKKDPIYYVGPVLAGDRLIVAGSNGALINVNPADGSFQSQVDIKQGVSFQPVVANNTLYLLTDNGTLIAYR